jgi:hypothetical protein
VRVAEGRNTVHATVFELFGFFGIQRKVIAVNCHVGKRDFHQVHGAVVLQSQKLLLVDLLRIEFKVDELLAGAGAPAGRRAGSRGTSAAGQGGFRFGHVAPRKGVGNGWQLNGRPHGVRLAWLNRLLVAIAQA